MAHLANGEPLDRRWRVSYRRNSRHLLVVLALMAAMWGIALWLV